MAAPSACQSHSSAHAGASLQAAPGCPHLSHTGKRAQYQGGGGWQEQGQCGAPAHRPSQAPAQLGGLSSTPQDEVAAPAPPGKAPGHAGVGRIQKHMSERATSTGLLGGTMTGLVNSRPPAALKPCHARPQACRRNFPCSPATGIAEAGRQPCSPAHQLRTAPCHGQAQPGRSPPTRSSPVLPTITRGSGSGAARAGWDTAAALASAGACSERTHRTPHGEDHVWVKDPGR